MKTPLASSSRARTGTWTRRRRRDRPGRRSSPAFSRSSNPSSDLVPERDRMPSTSRATGGGALLLAVTGENAQQIATALRSSACSRDPCARRLVERRDLAPVELVAPAQHVAMAADGGRPDRPANRSTAAAEPRRRKTEADRTPTGTRRRRSTMALVKCVVPIITARMSAAATLVSPNRSRSTRDDAGTDVRRCRRLAPSEHVEPVHQNGVGIWCLRHRCRCALPQSSRVRAKAPSDPASRRRRKIRCCYCLSDPLAGSLVPTIADE